MMHNGGISEFIEIKRDLINMLSNHYFHWIKGQTDSEHIFALYMQLVSDLSDGKKGEELSLDFLSDCFKKTFTLIEELKDKRGLKMPSVYNMVITDGERLLATRYSTNPSQEGRTLYFAKGKKYVCEGNICRMLADNGQTSSVLVVSEKLDEFVDKWELVPENHLLMIDKDLSYAIKSIN